MPGTLPDFAFQQIKRATEAALTFIMSVIRPYNLRMKLSCFAPAVIFSLKQHGMGAPKAPLPAIPTLSERLAAIDLVVSFLGFNSTSEKNYDSYVRLFLEATIAHTVNRLVIRWARIWSSMSPDRIQQRKQRPHATLAGLSKAQSSKCHDHARKGGRMIVSEPTCSPSGRDERH